jgi:hypothetical protein
MDTTAGQRRALVQLFQACPYPSTLAHLMGRRPRDQYSMILVRNGVMPGLRTGLTVTLPASDDASSI